MNQSKSKRTHIGCMGVLLLLILYPISCTVLSLAYGVLQPVERDAIGKEIPGDFPVLVVYQKEGDRETHVYPVFSREEEAFLKTVTQYSYWIPKNREEIFKKELEAMSCAQVKEESPRDCEFWNVSYEIEQRTQASTSVRLSFRKDDDDVNVGWYTATRDGWTAQYHRSYFGPGKAFEAIPFGFMSTFVLYLVAAVLWNKKGRKKH